MSVIFINEINNDGQMTDKMTDKGQMTDNIHVSKTHVVRGPPVRLSAISSIRKLPVGLGLCGLWNDTRESLVPLCGASLWRCGLWRCGL